VIVNPRYATQVREHAPETAKAAFCDEVSGLRYYNPTQGRWLSKDPIEEQGGLNIYGYVGNRPVSFIDPLGLTDCLCQKLREILDRVKDQKNANTAIEALLQQSNAIYPKETVSEGEWGGLSYKDSGSFRNTPLSYEGQSDGGIFYVPTPAQLAEAQQKGHELVGLAHGHPGSGPFSLPDYATSMSLNIPITAVGSNGTLYFFDPTSLSKDARQGLLDSVLNALKANGQDNLGNYPENYLRNLSPDLQKLLFSANLNATCPGFFK
jgi:RHS repeat-associated protein